MIQLSPRYDALRTRANQIHQLLDPQAAPKMRERLDAAVALFDLGLLKDEDAPLGDILEACRIKTIDTRHESATDITCAIIAADLTCDEDGNVRPMTGDDERRFDATLQKMLARKLRLHTSRTIVSLFIRGHETPDARQTQKQLANELKARLVDMKRTTVLTTENIVLERPSRCMALARMDAASNDAYSIARGLVEKERQLKEQAKLLLPIDDNGDVIGTQKPYFVIETRVAHEYTLNAYGELVPCCVKTRETTLVSWTPVDAARVISGSARKETSTQGKVS